MQPTSAVIDHASVYRSVSGDMELLSELVEVFREQVPGLAGALQDALARNDGAAAAAVAHKLIGSLSTLGAMCVATAARVERAASLGFLEEATRLARQLQGELDAVGPALERILDLEVLRAY